MSRDISHVSEYHLVSCHIKSYHVRACHFVSRHIKSCHVRECHFASRHIMSRQDMSRHVTSGHGTLRVLHDLLSSSVMRCWVISDLDFDEAMSDTEDS